MKDTEVIDGKIAAAREVGTFEDVLVRALDGLLVPFGVFGSLAFIAGSVTEIQSGRYLTLVTYIIVFIAGMTSAIVKKIDYRIRIAILIAGLYLLALSEIVNYGVASLAYMLFLMLISFAAIFYKKRVGLILLCLVMLNIAVVGALYLSHYVPIVTPSQATSRIFSNWLTGPSVFFFLCTLVISLIGLLVETLRANMAASALLVKNLQTEVAERTKTEEALRKSESELRQVIDLVPHSIYAKDKESRFIFCNVRSAKLMGTTPEAVVGKTQWELTPQPDEAEGLIAEDKEVLEKGQPIFGRERVFTDAQGIQHKEEVTKIPFVTQRAPEMALLGISLDITERKAAEERLRHSEEHFRSLVENVSEIVLLVDDDRIVRYCSPAVTRLLGYVPEEIEGKSALDIVHPDEREDVRLAIVRSAEGHPIKLEARIQHASGSWVDVEIAAKKTVDADAHIGWVITGRDITERKRAEAEREKLETQLRLSQKMEALGQLAGGVAHDFNNLLQGIMGYTELVCEQLDPTAQAYEDMRAIKELGERAASLTRQLLAFGRKQVLQPRYLNLDKVIPEFANMLKRLIGEHIALQLDIDEHVRPVYADRSQIEQVIMNLCLNARDSMPGGGTITITVTNCQIDDQFYKSGKFLQPGLFVRLQVKDTGCGIDRSTMQHIFEPFFTTKEHGRGTGLGLATVYGIVQQHKGQIDVTSDRGKGSSFDVYLPARVGTNEEESAQPLMVVPGGSETILVAEDNDTVRELAASMLADAGYNVLSAIDGEDALKVFKRHAGSVDLLLLDVVMPKLGGYGVYETLNRNRNNQPTLFTSGYAVVDGGKIPTFGKQVGFLQKPYTRQDLLQQVRHLLDSAE